MLAVGDFNRDGFDDLAMAAPFEGKSSASDQDGHVTVVLGTSSGLYVFRARGIAAGWDEIPGSKTEHNKNFGWALAAGDFDGDGYDDLAMGAPYENPAGRGDGGAQTILYGSPPDPSWAGLATPSMSIEFGAEKTTPCRGKLRLAGASPITAESRPRPPARWTESATSAEEAWGGAAS